MSSACTAVLSAVLSILPSVCYALADFTWILVFVGCVQTTARTATRRPNAQYAEMGSLQSMASALRDANIPALLARMGSLTHASAAFLVSRLMELPA